MRDDDILEALAEIHRTKLDARPLPEGVMGPELRLVEDLDLDSLQLLTLAMEVEDRFRIRLDEQDEAELRTVGDLVEVVRRKVGSCD